MFEVLIIVGLFVVLCTVANSGSKSRSNADRTKATHYNQGSGQKAHLSSVPKLDQVQPGIRLDVPVSGELQSRETILRGTAAKIEANRTFRKSFLTVHKGVDADCELAEIHAQIVEECADPTFARIFGEFASDSQALQPIFLSNLDVPLIDPASLPEGALIERIEMLRALLARISAVQRRLAIEPMFRKGMARIPHDQPYSSYLADQVCLAEAHLALLLPQVNYKSNTLEPAVVTPAPRAQDAAAITTKSDLATVAQLEAASPTSGANALLSARLEPAPDPVYPPAGTEARAHEVQREVEKRRIKYLVHFTRIDNLSSILTHGLCSKNDARHQGLRPLCNDTARYDGQLDGISLSVSFPNYRMFYKYRRMTERSDWVVLRLSPRIIWERDCAYYWTNAADNRVRHRDRSEFSTPQAFRNMFEPPEGKRDDWLSSFDPADDQAEIMVYETIAPAFVEAVVFQTEAAMLSAQKQLRGIPGLFAGRNSNYFASRKQAKFF